MNYASEKGRVPWARATLAARIRPPDLGDEEKAAVADRVRKLKANFPEAMDFIKALHEAGLVDGLRCVARVTVFAEDGDGTVG